MYPRQWCLDCGNQWWDAWFLGPARRCEAIHPGSQRRIHSLERKVAAKEGCEALLRGVLCGEADLLPDKNIYIQGKDSERLHWVCVGERDSTDCRCSEEPHGKPFLMSHKMYFFNLKELVISLSKFNLRVFTAVRSPIQQVLTALWSP